MAGVRDEGIILSKTQIRRSQSQNTEKRLRKSQIRRSQSHNTEKRLRNLRSRDHNLRSRDHSGLPLPLPLPPSVRPSLRTPLLGEKSCTCTRGPHHRSYRLAYHYHTSAPLNVGIKWHIIIAPHRRYHIGIISSDRSEKRPHQNTYHYQNFQALSLSIDESFLEWYLPLPHVHPVGKEQLLRGG